MEHNFFQRQDQKQILSPQIQQYLKLLQMPIMDLVQAIDAELAENPMLDETQAVSDSEKDNSDPENSFEDDSSKDEIQLGDTFDSFEKIDKSFEEGLDQNEYQNTHFKELQKRKDFQETLITKHETLSDFLLWQLRFLNFSPKDQEIAEEIIGNINDEGYLATPIEEISESINLELTKVSRILEFIQQLDPPGIGARSLQEALLLQLKKKKATDSLEWSIVNNHFDLLQKRDWRKIAKITEYSLNDVESAIKNIRKLEPKPGRPFFEAEAIRVTPDTTISIDEENSSQETKFKIDIHNEYIPSLRLNKHYRKMIKDKTTDPETKKFLKEKMKKALEFLKALDLRKSTLRAITEEIVHVQSLFLEKGFAHMVPLRLKDVADTIGIHESTVSRAIQGKYVQTPQGTLAYKSFFSTRLETTTGEAESQQSMIQKIKKLIEAENPKKPLSDQKIVDLIQAEGAKIARRTVTKYREMLKILPSHLRKQR